jgi:MFS family permease
MSDLQDNIETHNLEKSIIFRFCLYGFLKNQRYFEPFILLAFLEKELSFFIIGLLFGFRELCINLFEIPSGALADLYGRRKTMILSFLSYTISFLIFGASAQTWQLFLAMFFFSIGEAFRTGTHKAIIFDYLKSRGRENERVRIYGYTRSWSKIGSAVSAFIAACLVFLTGRYSNIFWLCAIPSIINVINFLGYPPEVEGQEHPRLHEMHIFKHTWESLVHAWVNKKQRMLLLESGGFEGVFKIAKDYIQPVIKTAAISLPFFTVLADHQRTALLVGIVYSFVFLFSSIVSRQAHILVKWKGSDDLASAVIWTAAVCFYGLLIPLLALKITVISLLLFLLIYLIQNIWRPLLVSRLNACSKPEQAATTLSIESQTKSTAAMIIAPVLGLAVDHLGIWSVGAFGCLISLFFWAKRKNI